MSKALEVQYPDNNSPHHSEDSDEEYMDAIDEDDTYEAVNDNFDRNTAIKAYRSLFEDESDTSTDENDFFAEEDKNNAVEDINETPSNPTSTSDTVDVT